MKTITVKKKYEGIISVRDYIINECIRKDISLKIKFGKESMVLTPKELVNSKIQLTKRFFTSGFNGKSYYLYDYRWRPDA